MPTTKKPRQTTRTKKTAEDNATLMIEQTEVMVGSGEVLPATTAEENDEPRIVDDDAETTSVKSTEPNRDQARSAEDTHSPAETMPEEKLDGPVLVDADFAQSPSGSPAPEAAGEDLEQAHQAARPANEPPPDPTMPAAPFVQNLDKWGIAAVSPESEEAIGLPDPTPESTDEELLHCCGSAVQQGEQAETVGLAFLRRSIRLRWRGCKAASIFRARHKETRDWGKLLKESKLPRSTLTEMADIYDRATEQGHGEEDVAKCRIWTEVKVAYGVVKPKTTTASGKKKKKLGSGTTPDSRLADGNGDTRPAARTAAR